MKQIIFALALISFGAIPAAAVERQTYLLRISGNLDATAAITPGIPLPGATFADFAAAAQFSATGEVRDSLLAAHTISIYFFHTAVNQWTVVLVAEGSELGQFGGAAELGRAVLAFGADGNRTTVPVLPLGDVNSTPAWSNGSASNAPVTFIFDPMTSLAQPSVIGSISDDSQRDCASLAGCLEQNLPAVLAACSAGSNSCALPLSDSLLIPADISSRAISAAGCEDRAFSSKRRCRDCYHRAWRKIRAASSTNLFGKFLSQALDQVNLRRDQRCR